MNRPPIELHAIANALGVKCYVAPVSDMPLHGGVFSNMAGVAQPGIGKVWISNDLPLADALFALFHELYHARSPRNLVTYDPQGERSNVEEYEADHVAELLCKRYGIATALIPRPWLRGSSRSRQRILRFYHHVLARLWVVLGVRPYA